MGNPMARNLLKTGHQQMFGYLNKNNLIKSGWGDAFGGSGNS